MLTEPVKAHDTYGEPYGTSGSSQTVFGYTGEPTDSSGLVQLRERYYNPTIGQFFNPDPAETDNRYAYVAGNPVNDAVGERIWSNPYTYVNGNVVNFTDPSGMYVCADPYTCQRSSAPTPVLNPLPAPTALVHDPVTSGIRTSAPPPTQNTGSTAVGTRSTPTTYNNVSASPAVAVYQPSTPTPAQSASFVHGITTSGVRSYTGNQLSELTSAARSGVEQQLQHISQSLMPPGAGTSLMKPRSDLGSCYEDCWRRYGSYFSWLSRQLCLAGCNLAAAIGPIINPGPLCPGGKFFWSAWSCTQGVMVIGYRYPSGIRVGKMDRCNPDELCCHGEVRGSDEDLLAVLSNGMTNPESWGQGCDDTLETADTRVQTALGLCIEAHAAAK